MRSPIFSVRGERGFPGRWPGRTETRQRRSSEADAGGDRPHRAELPGVRPAACFRYLHSKATPRGVLHAPLVRPINGLGRGGLTDGNRHGCDASRRGPSRIFTLKAVMFRAPDSASGALATGFWLLVERSGHATVSCSQTEATLRGNATHVPPAAGLPC